jgi:hypothetical protein
MDNILNGSYEQTERTFKHRVAFVESLRREPDMRRRMFDTLEQRFRQDFASDRTGKNLYDVLHAAVRDADVPGLETEFERRFLPLCRHAARELHLGHCSRANVPARCPTEGELLPVRHQLPLQHRPSGHEVCYSPPDRIGQGVVSAAPLGHTALG